MNNNYDPSQYNSYCNYDSYQQPCQKRNNLPDTTPMLVMAILGLVLGGVVGIVLSSISLSKIKDYLAMGGYLEGPVKASKIVATIGLVLSIIYVIAVTIAMPFYISYIFDTFGIYF